MLLIVLCSATAVLTLAIVGIVSVLRVTRITWDRLVARSGPPLWVALAEQEELWRLRRRGHYIARYHGTSPTALALTALAAPISVRDAIQACKQLGLSCELRDAWGEVIASIDKQGTVRIDVDDEEDAARA